MKKIFTKSYYLVLSLLLIYSCSTPKICPDKPIEGNFSQPLNSDLNETNPKIINNRFYTLIQENQEQTQKNIFKIYYSEINDNGFGPLKLDTLNPMNKMDGISSFSSYKKENGEFELYFSALNKTENKFSSDIFVMTFDGNNYSAPILLTGKINSNSYESQPSISKDGKILVFVSDKDGGFGKTDLYYSIRKLDNSWTEPINLGNNINTSNQDISPFLDDSLNLYYSTLSSNNGLNIVKSLYIGDFKWNIPYPLNSPINSSKNDINPFIQGNNIYLASDRDGGCGGYDLFSFPICNKVIVSGNINFGDLEASPDGFIKIYTLNNQLIKEYQVSNSTSFSFEIPAGNYYIFKYENDCFLNYFFEQRFFAPCSDTSTIKLVLNITLPDNINDFSIEKYDVPFFVSGYYMPNTSENLEDLKLKFSYNLLGNSDSTKYIENPQKNYDSYTYKVDKAIDECVEFINSLINFMNSKCSKGSEVLEIKVKGFADPRQLSSKAKYPGLDIQDKKLGVSILRGSQIDNEMLSILRAYFTAKLIQSRVEKSPNYVDFKDRIKWKIEGIGTEDDNSREFKLLRKVIIEFKVKN
jgi:hypothetical protein